MNFFSNSFSKFQFLNGQSVGEIGVFFPQGVTNTVSKTFLFWFNVDKLCKQLRYSECFPLFYSIFCGFYLFSALRLRIIKIVGKWKMQIKIWLPFPFRFIYEHFALFSLKHNYVYFFKNIVKIKLLTRKILEFR